MGGCGRRGSSWQRVSPGNSSRHIAMNDFARFVTENENADTTRLLLSYKGGDGFDIRLAASTIEVRRKIRKKVPSWYSVPELAFPSGLSAEQCSSEQTALYKAGIVSGLFPGGKARIADLTGGLGVDTWAFAGVGSAVLYNEMDRGLARAAEKNFRALGRENISVVSMELVPENEDVTVKDPGLAGGTGERETIRGSVREILGDFRPDVIFLDPARRGEGGRKVFLPEDCSPDVLQLSGELFRQSRYILLKMSPMADISLLLKRLGTGCREVHILAASGECKEVVILMDRDFCGECIFTVNSGGASLAFPMSGIADAVPEYVRNREEIREGSVLYEPGKALMKAGAFNLLCPLFHIRKLGRFTHYYLCGSAGEVSGRLPEELADNGKFFLVKEVLPLNKRSMREAGRKYGKGEVTARNLKMDSETLRSRLGIAPGGNLHFFGLQCLCGPAPENLLLVTEPLLP